MRTTRLGAFAGAMAIAALAACGGKSSARGGTGTGGAAGASAGGGPGTGGATSLTCTQEGALRLIGGVRHRCSHGTWMPVNVCMMATDLSSCCGGVSAMRSADVASRPCVAPYPSAQDRGTSASGCLRPGNCGTCGAIDLPQPRTAELDATGTCIPTSECQHSTDCEIALNNLTCCSCPAPFPQSMLAAEPCYSAAKALPGSDCADCSAVDCASCPPVGDPTPRCIPNGSGIRSCAYADVVGADCRPQDVAGLFPNPATGPCLPAMWMWNGTACVKFEGCLCGGADCAALFATPEACLSQYTRCGAVCVPGMDQTCNDDPLISSIAGHCENDGTCTCPPGRTYVQSSGRCR